MGFETGLFVAQPVDANLLCNVCHSVLEKPRTVCKNGHTFCQSCVTTWMKRSSNCPECRSDMCRDKLLNLPLQNLIKSLTVRCTEKPEEEDDDKPKSKRPRREGANYGPEKVETVEECGWEGPLSTFLEKHRDHECPYAIVKCPNLYCRMKVRACDLEAHKASECKGRMVSCSICQKQMMYRYLRSHEKRACPDAMVACKFCGEKMQRKHLGQYPHDYDVDDLPGVQSSKHGGYKGHYRTCGKTLVKCEFHEHGCTDKIPREDLADHHAKCARKHAALVAASIKQNRDDMQWHKCQARLKIPASLVRRALDSPSTTIIYKSGRVTVGSYRVFFQLAFEDNRVFVTVCADQVTDPPSIDNLLVEGDNVWLEAPKVQHMYFDNDETCVTSDETLPLRCNDDDDEGDANVHDLLQETVEETDLVELTVSFRLKGGAVPVYFSG